MQTKLHSSGQRGWRSARLVIVVLSLFLATVVLLTPTARAQTETVTPTGAPTKTATSTTSDARNSVTPEPEQTSRYSLSQADLTVLLGNVQRPNGLYWFNNMLYTACTGDFTLYEIHSETGVTQTYIGGVRNAHTLYVEENPNNSSRPAIWVPDYQMNTLLHISGGAPQIIAADLQGPWGIDYYDEDSFLVTNLLGGSVSTITRDGDTRVVIDNLASPTGIVRHGDYIYVANNGSTRRAIEWYSSDDVNSAMQLNRGIRGDESNLLLNGVQNTTGMTMAADGMLYFTFSLGTRGVVGRIDPVACRENGGCGNDEVEIVVLTELASPLAGLSISPDMRLFVHTMFSPEIYWVQL